MRLELKTSLLAIVRPAGIELPGRVTGDSNGVSAGDIDDPDIGCRAALHQRHRHALSIRTQVQGGEPSELAHRALSPAMPVPPRESLIREDRPARVRREHAGLRRRKGAESIPFVERRPGHDREGRPHDLTACVHRIAARRAAARSETADGLLNSAHSIRSVRATSRRCHPAIRCAAHPDRPVFPARDRESASRRAETRASDEPSLPSPSFVIATECRARSCRDPLQREVTRHEDDDVVAIPGAADFIASRSLVTLECVAHDRGKAAAERHGLELSPGKEADFAAIRLPERKQRAFGSGNLPILGRADGPHPKA